MNRYIVFLKQVPLSTKIKIDSKTNTLQRSSGATQTNPDDLYALEAAVSLRAKTGGEIIAVSMGPESAKATLIEAMQRGADRAILVSDRTFAGSDTWCTSYILSSVARKIGDYSLLLFGRMAIDGDTAQVGPEVAAQLNIPQVTLLKSIDNIDNQKIVVTRGDNNKTTQLEVMLPAAVMVSKSWGKLSSPTLKGWVEAKKRTIEYFDAQTLEIDSNSVGLMASPTRVVESFVPQSTKNIEWINSVEALSSIISKSLIK